MKYYFLLLFTVLFCGYQARSQTGGIPPRRLRISLITCGPGTEIYSVFGHTAVRITDSNSGADVVYNYGTFDGFAADFELQFMRGKLLYYLSAERFDDFMEIYSRGGRWTQEQVLLLTADQKH